MIIPIRGVNHILEQSHIDHSVLNVVPGSIASEGAGAAGGVALPADSTAEAVGHVIVHAGDFAVTGDSDVITDATHASKAKWRITDNPCWSMAQAATRSTCLLL